MKILIIRFSSIGDIVLTTPIIRCVQTRFPNAEIHYATKKQFEAVLQGNPHIHQLHFFENDVQPMVLDLLKEKFDIVIDLHKNWRSGYVKSLLKQAFNSQVVVINFDKLNIKKWLLTTFHINRMPDKSIVERYFESVKKIGVVNDGQGLDYYIPDEQKLDKDDIPMSHMLGYVACAIGGQHETKKMPLAQWQKLCSELSYPIILLGGKEDLAMADELKKIDPIKIYVACGKYSINESAHLVKKSQLVITHDTGLMHIAAAFKKPIISIWGNTVPAFGMFPYYGYNNMKSNIVPQLRIVENNNLSCRPCSKIGYESCPKKHFNCMNQLNMSDVVSQAMSILEKK